jgi:ribonucleoside-diphosphate reductase alpha chain
VRGVFPAYSGSSFEQEGLIQRNATTTTIAPTGTISIICNTSGGIEPLFSVGLTRTNVLDGDKMVEINELFKEEAAKRELWSSELAEKVAEQGKVGGLSEIPADMRRVFVTALEIAPEWHVRMQAAFQKVYGQCGEQDGELAPGSHQGRSGFDPAPRLSARLQGHYHLPGWQPPRTGPPCRKS